MSNMPLDLQRSCEEPWAARFLRPLASAAPQKHEDAKLELTPLDRTRGLLK
jgi:hypothetical protein